METGLWIILGVLVAVVCTIAAVAARATARRQSQLETAVRDELRHGREETAKTSRELREELASGLGRAQDYLGSTLTAASRLQNAELDTISGHVRELAGNTTTALERSRDTFSARL